MSHSEDGVEDFCPLPRLFALCYNSSTKFPELFRPLLLLLDDFLCCPCDLSMEYFVTHSVLVSHTMLFLIIFVFS